MRKNSKKASIMLQLIVSLVIVILLVFIGYTWYGNYKINARDTERITSIINLLSKIEAEYAKGVDYQILQINEKTNSGIILNGEENHISKQGTINFGAIGESKTYFQDPLNGEDFQFSYALGRVGNPGTFKDYNFIQIATINEKENKAVIIGNYKQYNRNTDSKSIITNMYGDIIIDGGNILPYDLPKEKSKISQFLFPQDN